MKANKIVLVMVAAATVLMFLFLPTFTFHEEEGLKGGYHFILNVPEDQKINGPLLLVEWFGILLVAAIILSITGSRNNKLREGKGDPESETGPSAGTMESPASDQQPGDAARGGRPRE